YGSTLRFPRGPTGRGVVTDLGAGGARIATDRPLERGEWIRIAWKPTLRDRQAMPEPLRACDAVRARVGREVDAVTDPDPDLAYSYGVELPRSRGHRALALFDLALPWLGLLLIVLTAADVVRLRGGNLYYFWYHPVVNLYGILISAYIISRIALACFYRPPRDLGLRPPVTVALSCKNEELSIGRTLDCIFASDYPEDRLQVIAVDDGS